MIDDHITIEVEVEQVEPNLDPDLVEVGAYADHLEVHLEAVDAAVDAARQEALQEVEDRFEMIEAAAREAAEKEFDRAWAEMLDEIGECEEEAA